MSGEEGAGERKKKAALPHFWWLCSCARLQGGLAPADSARQRWLWDQTCCRGWAVMAGWGLGYWGVLLAVAQFARADCFCLARTAAVAREKGGSLRNGLNCRLFFSLLTFDLNLAQI